MLRSGPSIARLPADVVDEDRPALLHRRADDSLADAQAADARQRVVGIADGVRDPQLLPLLVEQVHRERAEPGQPGDELRNLRQQLFEVEHRRDFAPELEQRRQQLGVGRDASPALQAGVGG